MSDCLFREASQYLHKKRGLFNDLPLLQSSVIYVNRIPSFPIVPTAAGKGQQWVQRWNRSASKFNQADHDTV